ncbi:NEDD4-binding protein 2-like 1 [Pseudolycoriella hygida]|uniref:NEDD4-binding protein 2-like 1 n=1 Tax=Pseudolycoriella hygida TaxID=35572 RepID=A0A9Q0RX88_9DIPT|nr:NEDD4-binding protein 2-like 1 [Pseudolycoriella hygida]
METDNSSYSNDDIFAFLSYEFDYVDSNIILNVCHAFNWNLDRCKEHLTALQNPKNVTEMNVANHVDVVVESEELEHMDERDDNLNKIENELKIIGIDDGKNLDKQLNFAGVIKKNRKPNNLINSAPHVTQPIRNDATAEFRDLQELRKEIIHGLKVMVIMRGAPGCGKSYLARQIVDSTTCDKYCHHIFSSDDFFYDRRGNYNFSANRLDEVHESNRKRVEQHACSGWSPIIVDNTNIRIWEMRNYFEIAVRFGYLVKIVEPKTTWSHSAGKLSVKNSHGVSKETIERMMFNYEPTSVELAMENFRLVYTMSMPQYRQFPPMDQYTDQEGKLDALKPQRTANRHRFDQVPEIEQYNPIKEAFQYVDKSNEWTPFEESQNMYWSNTQPSQASKSQPKQKLVPKNMSDNKSNTNALNKIHSNDNDHIEKDTQTELQKHRKNCRNENNYFAQIREIYPSVSLDILWDLFQKCEGDADWTMDILLKDEARIADYDNSDGAANDFECSCDFENCPTSLSIAAISIGKTSTPFKRPPRERLPTNHEGKLVAKRMIEERFTIGDEHYSSHTRKIRNLRHGVLSPVTVTEPEPNDEDGACADEEELLEINLGMDLVCQLDSVFGVEAYQRDALADMKTNVFMPKSLASQLYALWMESMYNQHEEQRKKNIEEDAELARQLQSQKNYADDTQLSDKDIVDMEYVWAVYNEEIDGWSHRKPQNLAQQLSQDKLCDLFPNIDRDTLIDVLVAHNNKFSEAVNVLRETLGNEPVHELSDRSRQLYEGVRAEVEMTANESQHSRPVVSLEAKKLGTEEARFCALKDFEDSRNLAKRHAQLRGECYEKARDAIQRGNPAVALYYSQVANLHKSQIETFDHKAANCLMEAHELTQKNPDVLDLHYLHVNEASECLDLFLDKHISKLKSQPQAYKNIFVITGRGRHSVNGIASIKQKVKSRFRDRNLPWSEVNPGLLKVKIFVNSRLTDGLPKYSHRFTQKNRKSKKKVIRIVLSSVQIHFLKQVIICHNNQLGVKFCLQVHFKMSCDMRSASTSVQIINQNLSIIQRLIETGRESELNQLRMETEKLFRDTEGQLDNLVVSNDDRHLRSRKNRLLDEFVEAKTAYLKLRR